MRGKSTLLMILWAPTALVACTEPDEGPRDAGLSSDAGDADGDGGALENAFSAAEPGHEGAALWIEGQVDAEGLVTLELWAAELGPIFGFAAHAEFDAEHLEAIDDGPVEPDHVLGNEPSTARYLSTVAPGNVSFGGTLVSPELEEVSIADKTRLAVIRIRARSIGRFPVTLNRAVVRRADGSFLPISVAGGEVSFAGGES